jgi:uncharacterized protein with HEPN domain
MYDRLLVLQILEQLLDASRRIQWRFQPIKESKDFTDSPWGMEKLDSICMLLIAIGESVKKLDKITSGQFLVNYPDIDWKGVKGLRDILSHQYFDVDAEEIFWLCNHHLQPLIQTLQKMIDDFQTK